MKLKCFDIVWETDEENVDLPSKCIVEIEDNEDIEYEAAEVLSNEYGFLVISFSYDIHKPVFSDLKEAILNVLGSVWVEYDNCGDRFYGIDTEPLRILQAEYNIHFIEPEDPQLEVIQ